MPTTDNTTIARRIVELPIGREMKNSYLDYAMSVIVSRALPDVRDGLKPVHRRILYAMEKLGLFPDKPYKKCASIVGEVLGKYHPHGDMAVYDALVRMAQSFSLRYPLIDGHGNFGSIDGDPPAAYRYTEARLNSLAMELLRDIDKETVEFRPNFDNSLTEPVVLPALLPNLLVNGSDGIAVGMATKIPPHNLGEVIDGIIATIDNPDITIDELIKIIPGPDFPTGAEIIGREGIISAYNTGRGQILMRPTVTIEEATGKRNNIIITELPYQVNKARLIEKIAELVKMKSLEGIAEIRDESDREGMRIVIELKKEANPQTVLNQLYLHTTLQCNFSVNSLVLVNNTPELLNLKQLIEYYIKHREEIITRRTTYLLLKAKKRSHIVEGLLKALSILDEIIQLIRSSNTTAEASSRLQIQFEFSPEQAEAILEMRLSRLTALEREKLSQEHTNLQAEIKYYQEILDNPEMLANVMKQELLELKNNYNEPRRTKIKEAIIQPAEEKELIIKQEVVILVTVDGYIKRMPLELYKRQKRGGKGVIGIITKEGDFVKEVLVTTTHHQLLIFTNLGRCYILRVYQIEESSRYTRGMSLRNLLKLLPEEKVSAVIPVEEFRNDCYLLMATKLGLVKKTPLIDYETPFKTTGINAIKLDENDELIKVKLIEEGKDITLITSQGKLARFSETEIRATGRYTRGVAGVRLKKGNTVVGMEVIDGSFTHLLLVTKRGRGKRVCVDEFHPYHRASSGVKGIKLRDSSDMVLGELGLKDEDEIVIITKVKGNIIRMEAKDIPHQSKNSIGAKLIDLEDDDEVSAIALIRE